MDRGNPVKNPEVKFCFVPHAMREAMVAYHLPWDWNVYKFDYTLLGEQWELVVAMCMGPFQIVVFLV